jgi:GT2 family glycosyltransferase
LRASCTKCDSYAKGDYVLQLDDDILLNNRCLERLVISLEELPEHSAVSPCLFNINGESLYESKKTGYKDYRLKMA